MPLLSDSAEPVARLQGAISDESAQARARDSMVVTQIIARGVRDARTLQAMRDVPRHLFVPPALLKQSYEDHPLPIGHGQTISQPYIVAFMTEALGLKGGETVLEVGAGSGYQSAVFSRIAARVFGIEIVEPLAREAKGRMVALGYGNVEIRAGDGYAGWPEHAPFDAILVAAAAPRVPEPLKRQLKDGGRLILPVGDHVQELRIVTRRGESFEERSVLAVQFVPMTGEIRRK
jgi:protein-L-isoaspartate(D-aspartate) O-methyltransferase